MSENYKNWTEFSLIDLAHYHNGYAFKPADWSEDGIRIIRIEQLNNPSGEYDHYRGIVPSINAINDGDLIFSWSATLKVAIWKHGPAVLNQHLFRVDPKPGFFKSFIHFLLDYHMEKLGGGSHGSTMKHIKRSELVKYKVNIPNYRAQQKIATILSTIDTAIEKTEALIAKYQQIKAGLMHDLFTRGVLPNGQLRPPREQAPELYQETAIGWIPKEWELLKVGDIVTSAEYGISESLSDHPVGIPILRMNNIKNGKFDLTDLKFGNSFDAHALTLKLGDVLYNRTNSMEHVGKAAIWHEETIKYSFASYLVRLNLDKTRVNPELFTFWFNQPSSQQALRRFATPAVQQVNINPTNVQKVNIALPSTLKEQKLAVTTLTKSDDLISSELERLLKLKSQKLGLMQDLLTGKVPVSVNEPEATHG